MRLVSALWLYQGQLNHNHQGYMNDYDRLVAQGKKLFAKYGAGLSRDKFMAISKKERPSKWQIRNVFGSWQEYRNECLDIDTLKHEPPLFPDKKEGEIHWREVIEVAKKQQKIHHKNQWTQDSCTIDLSNATEPVAVVYSADWHLGSLATDYDTWQADIEYLMNTPRLYIASAGDLTENMRKFYTVAPILAQVIQPDIQEAMLRNLVIELVSKNKLLLAGAGNHDVEFDEKLMGSSNVEKIISRLVPFFNGKGLAKIKVGNQEYTNLILHKTRYNSFLNELHGAKREYQLTFPADVVVTAHTHKPAWELYYHYEMAAELGLGIGPYSYLVKTGTYKVDDPYSKRFWTKGVIGLPTIVYHQDHREMVIFRTANQAVTYMRGLRA